jgi:hypothetical protein
MDQSAKQDREAPPSPQGDHNEPDRLLNGVPVMPLADDLHEGISTEDQSDHCDDLHYLDAIALDIAAAVNDMAALSAELGGSFHMRLWPGTLHRGKVSKSVNIAGCPCRPTVSGELVRLDFNEPSFIAATLYLRNALIPLVRPLVEGGWKTICWETQEGIVVLSADV